MKKIFAAIMVAYFFMSNVFCMMMVHKNGMKASQKKALVEKVQAVQKFEAEQVKFEAQQAKEFVKHFNNESLRTASEKFLTLPKNSAIKSLYMLNTNQKYFLATSMLSHELKIYAMSLLFNGHRQTAEQYCELPYRKMLKNNFRLEKNMKQCPISLIGITGTFKIDPEHYFHLGSDLAYLDQLQKGELVPKNSLIRSLSTVRTIEEEKMSQRAFDYKNFFCEQVLAQPFKFTIEMAEGQCGVERLRGDNDISFDDMFIRWFIGCPGDTSKLEKEIFLKNKRLEFQKIVNGHVHDAKGNFQFDTMEKDVLIIPTIQDRLANLVRTFRFGPPTNANPRWGATLITWMLLVKLTQYPVALLSHDYNRSLEAMQGDAWYILCKGFCLGATAMGAFISDYFYYDKAINTPIKNLNTLLPPKK